MPVADECHTVVQSSGGSRSLAARQASSRVTRALRIDGFVRPLMEQDAKDLISETGMSVLPQ